MPKHQRLRRELKDLSERLRKTGEYIDAATCQSAFVSMGSSNVTLSVLHGDNMELRRAIKAWQDRYPEAEFDPETGIVLGC